MSVYQLIVSKNLKNLVDENDCMAIRIVSPVSSFIPNMNDVGYLILQDALLCKGQLDMSKPKTVLVSSDGKLHSLAEFIKMKYNKFALTNEIGTHLTIEVGRCMPNDVPKDFSELGQITFANTTVEKISSSPQNKKITLPSIQHQISPPTVQTPPPLKRSRSSDDVSQENFVKEKKMCLVAPNKSCNLLNENETNGLLEYLNLLQPALIGLVKMDDAKWRIHAVQGMLKHRGASLLEKFDPESFMAFKEFVDKVEKNVSPSVLEISIKENDFVGKCLQSLQTQSER